MAVYNAAAVEDTDYVDPVLSNATAITSLNLTGTFFGSAGSVPISLTQDASDATTGLVDDYADGSDYTSTAILNWKAIYLTMAHRH